MLIINYLHRLLTPSCNDSLCHLLCCSMIVFLPLRYWQIRNVIINRVSGPCGLQFELIAVLSVLAFDRLQTVFRQVCFDNVVNNIRFNLN